MSLLKCPKCGEMFSDSYKTCPFCQEDEEFYSGKKPKNPGRRVERHKSPSILGPAMVLIVLLLVGFLTVTFLGDTIKSWFDRPAQEQPVDPDDAGGEQTPATLTLSQTAVTLETGATASLTASGAENVTWTSSNEAVATVDASGTVTAVAAGTATITATAAGATSAACEVTVSAPAKVLKLVTEYGADLYSPNEFSLGAGEKMDLKVDGTDSQPTWTISEGAEYASVDQNGVVSGVKVGRATLTVTVDGQTITCRVIVN